VRLRDTTVCITLLLSLAIYVSSQTEPAASTDAGKDVASREVLKVGGAVLPPKLIHHPNPKYSKEARNAKFQGVCVLWLVVGTDGKPHDIRVKRTLGLGLDEEAIKAVKKWTFEPARKDGQPVAVQINVEVSFKLY